MNLISKGKIGTELPIPSLHIYYAAMLFVEKHRREKERGRERVVQ